jgi:hypothetical protein
MEQHLYDAPKVSSPLSAEGSEDEYDSDEAAEESSSRDM